MTEEQVGPPVVPYVNKSYVPPVDRPFRAEDDILAEYPGDSEHPLQYIFRAVPRGAGRPPMNFDPTEQKLLAIHLERLGVQINPELVEIQYKMPDHGPEVSFNPGSWVDINVDLGDQNVDGTIDLTGVPPVELSSIEAAAQRERIRQARLLEADPIVTDEGEILPLDTVTGTARVVVVPVDQEDGQ